VAYPGQVIDNPENGERVRFLRTAGETGGQVLSFQSSLKPGGFVGAEHLHPLQTSHFQVLTGPVSFRVAGRLLRVARGETVTVLPGTPHRYWNPTDHVVSVVVQFRPALRTETLFEAFFGLAREGKVSGERICNPFQEAVLIEEFSAESRPTWGPGRWRALQLTARIGRLLGYRAVDLRYLASAPAGQPPAAAASAA